jgi:hypothetical protein
MIIPPAKADGDEGGGETTELATPEDQIAVVASGRMVGGISPTIIIKDSHGSRLGIT